MLYYDPDESGICDQGSSLKIISFGIVPVGMHWY